MDSGSLAFETSRLVAHYRQPRQSAAGLAGAKLWPLVDFVATGLPFLPVLPLLMMSPTWGLRASFVWEFNGKLDGLIYVIEVYSHFAALLLTGIVAFAAGWGLRHRALQFHSIGWAAADHRLASSISRCRGSSSRPTWRTSACRSRSPSW